VLVSLLYVGLVRFVIRLKYIPVAAATGMYFTEWKTTGFDDLSNLIYDKTAKTDSNMRKSVGPVERLAVTLR